MVTKSRKFGRAVSAVAAGLIGLSPVAIKEVDAKATNVVEWWVSSKSTNDSSFYLPENEFGLGSTNYLYVAVDTMQAIGTNFNSASWTVFTPVFQDFPNFVTYETNFFPRGYGEFAYNGVSINNSLTKIYQMPNSLGQLTTNNIAANTGSGFHDVTTNFPSAQQGGLLAVYEFRFTSDPLAVGTMTNFRLGSVSMVDTPAGKTWSIGNANLRTVNKSDFTIIGIPEPSTYLLFGGGLAALAGARRVRGRNTLADKVGGAGGSGDEGYDPSCSAYNGLPLHRRGRGRTKLI